jgi:prevent-host-death family protein
MAILEINVNEYPIVEAKDQLPRLIREAEAGNPVMVTRHGKPAAVLLSAVRYEQLTGATERFSGCRARIQSAIPSGRRPRRSLLEMSLAMCAMPPLGAM